MNTVSADVERGVDFTLPALVTVAQAPDLVRDALRALAGRAAPWCIDAGGLERFDSSCLALLMELRRRAGAAGLELRGVPERLHTLARAYGVGFVLGADADAYASDATSLAMQAAPGAGAATRPAP